MLGYFQKKYAKKDLTEVAKFIFDQMRYNLTSETLNDIPNKIKKGAQQAFGDNSGDVAGTFLFAKLPGQMQNELALVG